MTEALKQKAEEVANRFVKMIGYEGSIMVKRVSEAVQYGFEKGATENGIQWHDLRKDPNDLPKFRQDILVTCEYRDKFKKERETFEWDYKSDMPLHAIAWCEKPQFKE